MIEYNVYNLVRVYLQNFTSHRLVLNLSPVLPYTGHSPYRGSLIHCRKATSEVKAKNAEISSKDRGNKRGIDKPKKLVSRQVV